MSAAEDKAKEPEKVVIDLEGIGQRILPCPSRPRTTSSWPRARRGPLHP